MFSGRSPESLMMRIFSPVSNLWVPMLRALELTLLTLYSLTALIVPSADVMPVVLISLSTIKILAEYVVPEPTNDS